MAYAVVSAFLSFSFTEEDALGVFYGAYGLDWFFWRLLF